MAAVLVFGCLVWDAHRVTEEKQPGESPVRLEVNATAALEDLASAGIRLVDGALLPIGRAMADVAVTFLDVLKGPLLWLRVHQLMNLASTIRRLQAAQGVRHPRPLQPEVLQLIVDKGSLKDDAKIQHLWAQLIVNAQAGMAISAFLFELLSKLDADDVAILGAAAGLDRDKGESLARFDASTFKLKSLGLLELLQDVQVAIKTDPWRSTFGLDRVHTAEASMSSAGYVLSPLGAALYRAATAPAST